MRSGIHDLVSLSLLIVGALLPIVNPLGGAPIFLALTRGDSRETRTLLARKLPSTGFCF